MRPIRSVGAGLSVLCVIALLGLVAPAQADQTKRLLQHEGVRVFRGLDHKSGFEPLASPSKLAPTRQRLTPEFRTPAPKLRPPSSSTTAQPAGGAPKPRLRGDRPRSFGGRDIVILRAERLKGDRLRDHRSRKAHHPHFRRRGIPNPR